MATTIKIKRSLTAGVSPIALLTGELAVNITDKKLWVGDANGLPKLLLDAGAYLPLSGGTVTGVIDFPATTTSLYGLRFAGKTTIYDDASSLYIDYNNENVLYADYGTKTVVSQWDLRLVRQPTQDMHAATKLYVDEKLSTALLPTPTTTRLGGVHSGEATPGNVMYGIDTAGDPIFKAIAVPYPTSTTLGGVKTSDVVDGKYVAGLDSTGTFILGNMPGAYVLPYPKAMELGGVFASYEQAGKYVSAINDDGTVTLRDLPAASTPYTLPPATATVLGGVKIGSGITVAADGTISTSASGTYLPLAGGTMTGDITIPSNGATGIQVGTAATRMSISGGVSNIYVKYGANNVMWMGSAQVQAYVPIVLPADPTTALQAATKQYVDSKVGTGGTTAYLPLAGGTMTGEITLPASGVALGFGTATNRVYLSTGYASAVFATPAGGGMNILTVSTSQLSSTVPLVLPSDPTTNLQAATKQYVDTQFTNAAFLRKAGDAMTGPLRFTATANPSTYNGTDVYLWYSTDGNVRMQLPSSKNAFTLSNSTGVMNFTYLPTCTAGPTTNEQLANKAYVDSKAYTLPTASASVLGGIKVGAGLSIDATTGVLSSPTYQLPTASASVLGGVKVGTGLSIDPTTGVLSASGGSGTYLPLSGGTMTGYITLHNNPSSALHPVTKQYCDATTADKVAKGGDTMTGPLTLSGPPSAALHAVTKAYADASYAPKVVVAEIDALKADFAALKAAAVAKKSTSTIDATQQHEINALKRHVADLELMIKELKKGLAK